jgi:hypothetical protein
LGQGHDADGAGAVVVGPVIDARGADALVIEVGAEDDGLGLKRGVAAFEEAGDVVRGGAPAVGGGG